jgi:tRNA 2-thiouridine synthesizing protein C
MKKILYLLKQAPHQGIDLQETLDSILTMAAFDQRVGLLFVDDGVLQLQQHQKPDVLSLKDTAAIFKALEIYDIEDFFVEVESLQERGLKPVDLFLPVQEVYRKNVNNLVQEYDVFFMS